MLVKLVALNVLIYFVLSNKVPEDLIDDWNNAASIYSAECVKETGANPMLVESMFKEHKLIDEEHMRCFMKCLNDKYEHVFPNGTYNRDKIVSDLEHLTYEILDKCLNKLKNEYDLCRKSYLLAVCAAEENHVT